MRIRVEMGSGRAFSGIVAEADEHVVRALLGSSGFPIATSGFIRLFDESGNSTSVNVTQAESIAELPA